MSGRRLWRASWLTALLAAATTAMAGSTLALSLERMLDRSEIRVFGDVVAVDSEVADDGEIRTRVEISVVRDLRSDEQEDAGGPDGQDAPEIVVLRFSGGELDDGSTAVVDDVPRLQEGDRVLALAYRDDALASPIVGVWQGLWLVDADGLVDRLGRVLGLDDGVVRQGGADRDVDTVLDALASGAELGDAPGAAESPPGEPATTDGDEPDPDEPDADEPDEAEEDAGDDDGAADDAAPERIEVPVDVAEDDGLRSALQRAASAWRDAGAPLELVFDDDADDRVRVGSADLFGPDALAFTRRVPSRSGVEVLLRPGNEGLRVDVLARELGLLVGLPPGDGPLRSGVLPADDEARPSADDADELLASRDRTPEDLNGDGVVDLYDLALLAEAYGRTGTRLAADLDGSGRVDDADVERLRAAYEYLPASREAPSDRRRPNDR